MKRYFLFGDDASVLYDEGRMYDILNEMYDVFEWGKLTDPQEILNAFNGWRDYREITREEYNLLKK